MVNERTLQIEKIINLLEIHFFEIMNGNSYYKGKEIKISSEQQFVKEKERNPGKIYIVVKVGSTSLDFDQAILPITIVAISEKNSLEVCRNLLLDFVEKYNLQWTKQDGIREFWDTPAPISNFDEVYDGFRSTFYLTGSILISEGANFGELFYLSGYDAKLMDKNNELKSIKLTIKNRLPFDKKYFETHIFGQKITYNKEEETWYWENGEFETQEFVDFGDVLLEDGDYIIINKKWEDTHPISFVTGANINLDSQVFYNTKNFTKSIGMFGTSLLTLSTYLFDNDFCNKCLAVYLKDLNKEPDGVNTNFYLKVKFTNNIESEQIWKLVSFTLSTSVDEIPMVSMSFAN